MFLVLFLLTLNADMFHPLFVQMSALTKLILMPVCLFPYQFHGYSDSFLPDMDILFLSVTLYIECSLKQSSSVCCSSSLSTH